MFGFLKGLFGSKKRRAATPARQSLRPRSRLGVEELTPRVLPSASPFGLAAGHFGPHGGPAIFSTAASSTLTTTGGCADGGQSSTNDGGGDYCNHGATLEASLTDSSGATGTAYYNAATDVLKVKVSGASTSASLTVSVNGTMVGTLTTDSSGDGSMTLSNITASAGQTITVGDLTGTLEKTKFSASLTGATSSVSGKAEFNVENSRLRVYITGAAADTTYNVTVNNTVVGQITTNGSGSGKLKVTLTSATTITTGSTISIADTLGDPAILTGTFA